MSGCSASIDAIEQRRRRHRPRARPSSRARAPARRARAPPRTPRLRGDGGKNTKPTMSAPASSATSSASGVFRPQILTVNGHDARRGSTSAGRFVAFRKASDARTRRRRDRSGLRRGPRPGGVPSASAARAAHRPRVPAQSRARRARDRRAAAATCPAAARPQCRRGSRRGSTSTKISANSGSVSRKRRMRRVERIERNRHDLPVRDREHDDDDRERNQDQRGDELAHGTETCRGSIAPASCRLAGACSRLHAAGALFSRSRISLPVLKNGTDSARPRHARRCADCGRCGPGGA